LNDIYLQVNTHNSSFSEIELLAGRLYNVTDFKISNNITKNNIHEIMLMQIPGISDTVACHIMKEFKTIQELATVVQTDMERIKAFTYVEKDKTKRLNKTVIEGLKYL
jgi:ERCC4-type nuclease